MSKKVFISYSWSNPAHEDWVINLAQRLVSDGVDVIIDKWSLKEGQDKYNFMESMVKSDEIQKVLIVLDKKYAEKAESRAGGVGTETQIIGPKVYNNVSQEKFVPIAREKNPDGEAYVPSYLASRIYIDFTEESKFESGYEALLRNIFERPAFSKPKLGTPPGYLFEETPMSHKTTGIIRGFEYQIAKFPNRINSIVREFLNNFFSDLRGYSLNIEQTSSALVFGKAVHDNLVSYMPLRNDYVVFLDKLFKNELDFDVEIFIKFFEKLPLLNSPLDGRTSWTDNEFDNFRFIQHEILLFTVAIGLKNERYKFVEEIMYSGYFFQGKYNFREEPKRFDGLYNYVQVFDSYYKQTYSQNFLSPMADLIIKSLPDTITRDEFIDADMLCYYVSVLDGLQWFPITYVYRERRDKSMEIFQRLISLRHFERVKGLFNVKSVKEFQDKLSSLKSQDNHQREGYSGSFERIVPIFNLVEISKIGTLR